MWLATALADETAGVREYLDSTTAVTVTVVTEPLVFARERSDLAVNARDYLSLTPLEVNQSGKRACYWSGYVWSTIDRRDGEPLLAPGDELVLIADDRPIPLRADSRSMSDIGIVDAPTRPPRRGAVPLLFSVGRDTVDYVASAGALHVEWVHDGVSESYQLWHDSRAMLRGLSDRIDCG